MNDFTPQQQQMLQTWAEKRDSLIRDIGTFQTELDTIKRDTKSQGLALSDLHTQIAEARGRLSEITALEERHKNSVSTEVSALEARKSRLESECAAEENKIKLAIVAHELTVEATIALKSAQDMMKDQSATVDSVVGKIVELSHLHMSDVKTVMAEVKDITDQVIEKGNANVAQTNIVLDKLPQYLLELKRPAPLERVRVLPLKARVSQLGKRE